MQYLLIIVNGPKLAWYFVSGDVVSARIKSINIYDLH